MPSKVLNLYKKIGETPLARIERFRKDNPEYAKSKMSYAGRLDPMAEGLLLVLVGEENKKKDTYLNLSKEYTAEVLFGIETDTYDVLGKVVNVAKVNESTEKIKNGIEKCTKNFLGVQSQKYPAYSSKNVDGKPLFKWAREGRVDEIKIPQREIEIFSIKILGLRTLSENDLMSLVEERILLVKGDFRQTEILSSWSENFNNRGNHTYIVVTLDVSCSSGTYIRSLAHELGICLNTVALLFSLKRNSVGKYSVKDSIS